MPRDLKRFSFVWRNTLLWEQHENEWLASAA